MKFTSIKNLVLTCLMLGSIQSAFAADWRSYLEAAKSRIGSFWQGVQQQGAGASESSAAASSMPAEPVVEPVSLVGQLPFSSSRAETSAGQSAATPSSPQSYAEFRERSKQRVSQAALRSLLPAVSLGTPPLLAVTDENTACVQSILEDLSDYINLVKGMFTSSNDPHRDIETKSQMQEAVYRLLQFKRLLINKLPRDENIALLRESEQEIDDWKHKIPFHTRHYDKPQGYRTQEEIFATGRTTPRSPIQLAPVPARMFPGTNKPAPKVQLGHVPTVITADQFGHEISGQGAATAMGYVAGMSPEQEAALRERMAPSSSSGASSSEYYGYETSPGQVVVEPLAEGQ